MIHNYENNGTQVILITWDPENTGKQAILMSWEPGNMFKSYFLSVVHAAGAFFATKSRAPDHPIRSVSSS